MTNIIASASAGTKLKATLVLTNLTNNGIMRNASVNVTTQDSVKEGSSGIQGHANVNLTQKFAPDLVVDLQEEIGEEEIKTSWTEIHGMHQLHPNSTL